MKRFTKKLIAAVLGAAMAASLAGQAVLAATEAGKVIENDKYIAQKISNPTKGEAEADGLNGDRKNSYAWSMEEMCDEYGDYIYIGSNRNILYASLGGGLVGMDTTGGAANAMIDAITNGELDTDPDKLSLTKAVIVRYNRATDEMETWFNSGDYPWGSAGFNDYGMISGFRAVKSFKGSLYFNAVSSSPLSTSGSFIYRIKDNSSTVPEVVFRSNGKAGYMRAAGVSEDGETMYIGGTDGMMSSNVADTDYKIVVYKTTDGENYELIADERDFTAYEKAEYRSSGGDVWELVCHNGEIFFTLMTMKGGMVFRAHEDPTAPNANAYGWVWEEFAGEDADSPYDAGFGNAYNYALTPVVFGEDLYFISFSNAMDSIINGAIGLTTAVMGDAEDRDINKFFDSLELMEAVMDNETSVFRLKDGKMQMVVGDKKNCPDNVEYVAEMQAGFNDADFSTTTYNWRASVYNGKLYIGTFDAYPMFKYLSKLTNGDLLNMNSEEFRRQLEYLITFLKLALGQNAEADAATREAAGMMKGLSDEDIEKLLDTAVSIQQGLDKQATSSFLYSVLRAAPRFAKPMARLSKTLNGLQKIALRASTRESLGQAAEAIGMLSDLMNANSEGIERYIRISETIAANENPGCELYGTADGIHYDTVTLNGFEDEYNYGVRTLLTVDDGLMVGTANPFYGAQLWKVVEKAN